MIRVGLTGNVASGKSAVSAFWRDAGIPVVSADELSRLAVEAGSPALAQIEEHFGSEVLLPGGGLDRGAMRQIVFSDTAALRRLEAIVHPIVDELRQAWIQDQRQQGAEIVAMEVPLLLQVGLDKAVDVVVVVDAPAEVRKRRIVDTRGLSPSEAQAIMDVQPPSDALTERADFVIKNDGTLPELEARAGEVLDQIRANRSSGDTRAIQGDEPRRGSPQEILEALNGKSRIVLTTHVNADGDGAGCEVALAAFLREHGKEVWIVNPTPFPDAYRFLVPDDAWICDVGTEEANQRCLEADLGIVVDTSEVNRIGRAKAPFAHLPLLVIDHHQPGDRPLEGQYFRDASAAATGELVYEIMDAAGGPWPQAAVDGLYVALLTDTGGFRFSNATARCFATAAGLVARGARPDALYDQVYGHFSLNRYRLLQEALETLDVHEDGRVAWMVVPTEAYERLGAAPEDLEGFVDVPRNLSGVEVALLFRKTSDGSVKVSFRSNGEADVNQIARTFGGGGHRKASGALVKGPVSTAIDAVVAAVLGGIEGMDRP